MRAQPLQVAKKRGRPPMTVDPLTLELLTIPQALNVTRKVGAGPEHEKGRGISRARLNDLVLAGEVRAMEDLRHLDKNGHPRLLIVRTSLEAWLRAGLREFLPPFTGLARQGA